MKGLINLGVRPDDSTYDRISIKLTNQFALLIIALDILFVGLFYYYFKPILWLAILNLISPFIALGFNAIRLRTASRYLLVLAPIFAIIISNAYISPTGSPPLFGYQSLVIALLFIPFAIFNYKERKDQIFVFLIGVTLIVFFGYLNERLEADLNYEAATGTFNSICLVVTLGAVFGIGTSIYNTSNLLIQRNDRLYVESDEQKRELEQNQAELSNKLSELSKSKEEDERKNWITTGLAKHGQMMRTINTSQELYDTLVPSIVKYVSANQAGLFVLNQETEELDLVSAYAYDRKKFISKSIGKTEGLVGQCFMEKDAINIKEIPEDYVQITSGLGGAVPKNLILIPLKDNEEMMGVLEIAAFESFTDDAFTFLKQLGEELGNSINSNRLNEVTRDLLEQSRQQAEEMKAQEEEMRQNMEELEATQEEMARAQRELSQKESNLDAFINNTTDSIITINRNYEVEIINKVVKDRYRGTAYENIDKGSNVLDMLGDVRDEWQGYYDQAFAGERLNFVIESSVSKEESHYREYFVNPIINEEGEITNVSVLSRDVTKTEQGKKELQEKESALQTIINSTTDTFFAIDQDYKIIIANSVIKGRFRDAGVEMKEGMDIRGFLNEDTKKYWLPHYERILKGEDYVFEHDRPTKEKTLYLKVYCKPLKNADGSVFGASVRSQDITEYKQMMDELNAYKEG